MDQRIKTPYATDGYIIDQALMTNIRYGALTSDINGCTGDLKNANGTDSDIRAIVKQLDNAVDLVISGHTHAAYNCSANTIDVTGTSLADFLDEEVFTPLDLDMVLDPEGPWQQVGDGSIWTTPSELVEWSTQYWDQTLDGPDLATVMFDPEVNASDDEGDTDDTYGSGIMRGTDDDGTEWFFHDGSWGRYETDWTLIPDEHLAAAVTCDVDATLDRDEPARDLVELWRS